MNAHICICICVYISLSLSLYIYIYIYTCVYIYIYIIIMGVWGLLVIKTLSFRMFKDFFTNDKARIGFFQHADVKACSPIKPPSI